MALPFKNIQNKEAPSDYIKKQNKTKPPPKKNPAKFKKKSQQQNKTKKPKQIRGDRLIINTTENHST